MALRPPYEVRTVFFDGEPERLEEHGVRSVLARIEWDFLGEAKSMHVPAFDTPGWNAAGEEMTWIESMCDFFDRHVEIGEHLPYDNGVNQIFALVIGDKSHPHSSPDQSFCEGG